MAAASTDVTTALKNELEQKIAKSGYEHEDTLNIMNILAIHYHATGNYEDARKLLEKILPIRQKTLGIEHPHTLAIMNNLATCYLDMGYYDKSLDLFEKTVQLRKKILGKEHPETLASIAGMANYYQRMGYYNDALKLYKETLMLMQKNLGKEHLYTIKNMNNLASLYQAMGRYDGAIKLLEEILLLMQKKSGNENLNTLYIRSGLANCYQLVGRDEDSLKLRGETLLLMQKNLGRKHPATLGSMNDLAIYYQNIGQYEDALKLFIEVLKLRQEILGMEHPYTLESMNNLANCYRAAERYEDALKLAEETLQLRKNILGLEHSDTLVSMTTLASCYQYMGNYKEALKLKKETLQLSRKILGMEHPYTLSNMYNLANYQQLMGFYDEAFKLAEDTLQLRQKILGKEHPDTLMSMNNLAICYINNNNPQEAQNLYKEAIRGVEKLRNQRGLPPDYRQSLFSKFIDIYKDSLALDVIQGNWVDAFYTAEQCKARSLLEIVSAKFVDQSGILSSADLNIRRNMEYGLANFNNSISAEKAKNEKEKNNELIRNLEIERNKLYNKYRDFYQELVVKHPDYAKMQNIAIAKAGDTKNLLPSDTAFISYIENKGNIVVFVLDSDGNPFAKYLGNIKDLDNLILIYAKLLKNKDINTLNTNGWFIWQLPDGSFKINKDSYNSPTNAAQKANSAKQFQECLNWSEKLLSDKLLAPIETQLLGKKKWIISPDGALAAIPFETLTFAEQPAIMHADISYIHSLSMLALLKERNKELAAFKYSKDLLAIGNPKYWERNENIRGTNEDEIEDNPEKKWSSLEKSQEEVEEIAKQFARKRVDIYLQDQASLVNVRNLEQAKKLTGYKYILFSTHGFLNSKLPERSAIVLSQIGNPPGVDGYLRAAELSGYNLKSQLVFLSACETGLGENIAGEGIIGLPFALYVAGNQNTVMTLWAVNDHATAKFSISFFEKIARGMNQVTALNETKREFVSGNNVEYRSPYYWAPFVLYGI